MALKVPFDSFSYHPYQVDAINWMKVRESEIAHYLRGGILADEMGLGKTWMTIGLLLNNPLPHTLLLVPPVLIPQWLEVLTKSGIPHRTLTGVTKFGTGKWEYVPGIHTHLQVTICTYDRTVYNRKIICEQSYDRIVADEGHLLRNGPKTKRFLCTVDIPTKTRWILSGTPIQNKASNFTFLLKWLGVSIDISFLTNLQEIANTLILRRTVADVRTIVSDVPKTLPKHIVHPVSIPDDSEEQKVFQALVGRLEHAIEERAANTIILELYLRIQQFLAHPAIYVDAMIRKYGETYKRKSWTDSCSKMTTFDTWLSSASKEPTIVFVHFRKHLELAVSLLEKQGYSVTCICGGLTQSMRTSAIENSRKSVLEGRPTAMVVQIVAGNAGLNLQHCTRIVFLTSHWNPAVVDQAVARVYRIGQKSDVSVHHFLLADNVERNIDRLMVEKHAEKRGIALNIHPKLYCESAVHEPDVLDELEACLNE